MEAKRLKKKNLLIIKNKTLIEHSYHIAKKSKFIDELVVYTESDLIKNILRSISKNKILIRPKFLSKPKVSGTRVITHILKKKKKKL